MFELILRAPRSKQVLVYSRFYISQNLLYSQKKSHGGFLWVLHGNVNGKFEEKSEKLKFFIQNSYWEQNSLFAVVPLLAHIAQLVEHLASYHEVMSSSARRSKKTFYSRLCTIITHSPSQSAPWYLICQADLIFF